MLTVSVGSVDDVGSSKETNFEEKWEKDAIFATNQSLSMYQYGIKLAETSMRS
jgi:hypothetical protein